MSIVATNTRRILDERCIKQSQFAERYGFGVKELSALLTGRRPIRETHIIRLSNALGVQPSELFVGMDTATISEQFANAYKSRT